MSENECQMHISSDDMWEGESVRTTGLVRNTVKADSAISTKSKISIPVGSQEGIKGCEKDSKGKKGGEGARHGRRRSGRLGRQF